MRVCVCAVCGAHLDGLLCPLGRQRVLNLEMGFEALVKTISQNVPLLPNVHVEWENLSYSVAVPGAFGCPTILRWHVVVVMLLLLLPMAHRRVAARGKHVDRGVWHVHGSVPRQEAAPVPCAEQCVRTPAPGNCYAAVGSPWAWQERPVEGVVQSNPPGQARRAHLVRWPLTRRGEREPTLYVPVQRCCVHVETVVRLTCANVTITAAAYVDQTDIHLPLLSVKETFDFAFHAWAGKERPGFNDLMRAADQQKVHNLLQILGLEHCKDTMVGNDMIRGVSGGEKKRVTFGEMVAGNARVLMLDEIRCVRVSGCACLEHAQRLSHRAWCFPVCSARASTLPLPLTSRAPSVRSRRRSTRR